MPDFDFSRRAFWELYQDQVAWTIDMVRRLNTGSLIIYEQSYRNAELNWRSGSHKCPVLKPGLKAVYWHDDEKMECGWRFGPELVCEERTLPWDIEEPAPEPGTVVFGPVIMETPKGPVYAAYGSSVEEGHRARHPETRKLYEFMVLGRGFMLTECWMPV